MRLEEQQRGICGYKAVVGVKIVRDETTEVVRSHAIEGIARCNDWL